MLYRAFSGLLWVAIGSVLATGQANAEEVVPGESTDTGVYIAGEVFETPALRAASAAMEATSTAAPTVAEANETAPDEAHDWAPFEVGRRWTYVYVQERVRSVWGVPIHTEMLRGTRIDEVTGEAPEFGSDVIRLQSSMKGRSDADLEGPEIVQNFDNFYRSQGARFEAVAQEGGPGVETKGLIEHESPLKLLESGVELGQKWDVGVQQQGDLTTQLVGEVLGVQDAQTPAGLFERCLVVRVEGAVSGVVEANGTRMEVPEGKTTTTVWYAPGVGRVLAKEVLSNTVVLEDGTSFEYSEQTQYALRSTETSTPASPQPAADPDN